MASAAFLLQTFSTNASSPRPTTTVGHQGSGEGCDGPRAADQLRTSLRHTSHFGGKDKGGNWEVLSSGFLVGFDGFWLCFLNVFWFLIYCL